MRECGSPRVRTCTGTIESTSTVFSHDLSSQVKSMAKEETRLAVQLTDCKPLARPTAASLKGETDFSRHGWSFALQPSGLAQVSRYPDLG